MVLVLAQVPVGFRGDRVGQGYLVCGGGILATMYNGGNVRTSFGVLVIMCSVLQKLRKAHLREYPCNPDVYDKSRGVCAHDNSVRCARTAVFCGGDQSPFSRREVGYTI